VKGGGFGCRRGEGEVGRVVDSVLEIAEERRMGRWTNGKVVMG